MGKVLLLILIVPLLVACKTKTLYVPLETTKYEYVDKVLRDSIFRHDSVVVRTKADTIFFERYRYIYRNKVIRDSVLRVDTIPKPYPVIEYVDVNRLTSFQNFQIWCGRILLFLLIAYGGIIYLKRFL